MSDVRIVRIKPEVLKAFPASLDCYIVEAPKQSPAWQFYTVDLFHLRFLPGFPTVFKDFPEAQYEISVAALDPNVRPVSGDVTTLSRLAPRNHYQQFNVPSDDDARAVLEELMELVQLEKLLVEPLLSTGGGTDRTWKSRTDFIVSKYAR